MYKLSAPQRTFILDNLLFNRDWNLSYASHDILLGKIILKDSYNDEERRVINNEILIDYKSRLKVRDH